ncbi:MAG TPA: GntR family transcriptional regulator [Bacillota bacterium]|nr:GntR family transcriptional regulator [Bacillota bacterium]
MPNSKHVPPKYLQLKEHLSNKIQRGELAPGDQIPSENLLAYQFQISRPTVRHALDDLENSGLIIRRQGRGAFVAHTSPRTETIAVIVKSITNYIFPNIIDGIQEILHEAGFELLLFVSKNDSEREVQILRRLRSEKISGIIIEPAKNLGLCHTLQSFREFEQRQIPYLFIHSYLPELDPAYVILDDYRGGYLATQYLLQLGHKSIAGIFKTDLRQGLDRFNGYKKALQEYGIRTVPWWSGEYEAGHETYPFQFTQELLKRENRPTAIVCYNDQDAIRALEAIRMAGLKVPEDISIIGYNDSTLTTFSEIKLTSIKHPKQELGQEAARLIISMIQGRIEKPRLVYQPELIIRSSCRRISP